MIRRARHVLVFALLLAVVWRLVRSDGVSGAAALSPGDAPVEAVAAEPRSNLAARRIDAGPLREAATDADARGALGLEPAAAAQPDVRKAGTATLELEVLEGDPPATAEGVRVFLELISEADGDVRILETDVAGLARATELSPGRWAYSAQPKGSEHSVGGEVELAEGELRRVTVGLDSGDTSLAVAGRFVDEQGAPIELGPGEHPNLWVGSSLADQSGGTGPSADGTFRVYLPRSRWVLVRNFGGHRYEPELARVPYGTRDLVLRRVERFPLRTIVVDVRDVSDETPIERPYLSVYEVDARAALGMSLLKRPARGRVQTNTLVRPNTRIAVHAEGYAPVFLPVPPSGADAEAPLIVRLERGGRRELFVVDAERELPLPGVELRDAAGAIVATTDSRGRAEVRADHAGWLTLDHPGFESQRFHPAWPWDRAVLARR